MNEATLASASPVCQASSATDSISPKSATATCPAGTRLIGTGWANDGGQVGDNKEILADEVVPNGRAHRGLGDELRDGLDRR